MRDYDPPLYESPWEDGPPEAWAPLELSPPESAERMLSGVLMLLALFLVGAILMWLVA